MERTTAPHVESMVTDYFNPEIIAIHYNFTGKYRLTEYTGLKADLVVFIVICCFIILENIMVLLTIWRTKKFHKPMYYFIGNLALSDLLAGSVYICNILLSGPNTFKLTPFQWFMREGSMFVALGASVFSLLAIAIERHLTMLKMKLHNGGNTCRVFVYISTCWFLSAILGGLPIMGWNCIHSLETCSTVLPLYNKAYLLFCTTVFSVILMAIVILYARIYSLVKPSSNQVNLASCCVMPPDLTAFAKEYDIQLLTHNDSKELITETSFQESVSEGVKDAVVADWSLEWVLRYSIIVKSRGIIKSKGYLVQARRIGS
ncbi:UNVERIFIED_CONTAM: hypothetical protein FKN15_020797 [Acipenser sinensis]